MAILNAVLATTGGIDPATGKERKPIKDRFVFGDQFYQGLHYKREKGKLVVKGPNHSKYQVLKYMTFEEHLAENAKKRNVPVRKVPAGLSTIF